MVLQHREAEAVLQIHADRLLSHSVDLHQRAVGVVSHHVALRAADRYEVKNTHLYQITLAQLEIKKDLFGFSQLWRKIRWS